MLKLNFDGSSLGNPGMASIGGVIRNEEGTILLYYSGPARVCSNNKAELLSLNIGLQKAFRFGNKRLIIKGQWRTEDFYLGGLDNGQLKRSKSTPTSNNLHLLHGLNT